MYRKWKWLSWKKVSSFMPRHKNNKIWVKGTISLLEELSLKGKVISAMDSNLFPEKIMIRTDQQKKKPL